LAEFGDIPDASHRIEFSRGGNGSMCLFTRMTQKVRNVLRGFLQRYGTESMKRRLWDSEYMRGRWNYLETVAGDSLHPHVEKYANGGDILDLGCGLGNTGNQLSATAYRSYTGVDISDVAIEKARRKTEENDRSDKHEYFASDIVSHVPGREYDVILFGESIYYLPHGRITGVLDRYSMYLKPGGVFIVRIHDGRGRYQTIINAIESNFDIVEKHVYDREVFVIAFRPLASRYPVSLDNRAVSFSLFTHLAFEILQGVGSTALAL
jgi:2-polyprenyl-6-hydroxyphenyl methylase/3-demethylubiquinone-9 3-methyltransferase